MNDLVTRAEVQEVRDAIEALVSLVNPAQYQRAIAAVRANRDKARAAELVKAGTYRAAEAIGPETTETIWRRIDGNQVTADVLFLPASGFAQDALAKLQGVTVGKSITLDGGPVLEFLGALDRVVEPPKDTISAEFAPSAAAMTDMVHVVDAVGRGKPRRTRGKR